MLELLERDEEEIEMKAEQLRSSLLERVKQRTQPHVEHFRKEINALKDVKKVLKEDGLLDTFSIIAQERGLNVDNDSEDESSASDDETKEGMIALSDDEDESMGSEDGQTQTPKVPPICGGHIKTVKRFVRNNARLSLKSKLQQKTLLQSSEMTAKRFGLTNSHDLVTVLGGMELERYYNFILL